MRKKQVSIDDLSIWKPDKPSSKWWSRVSRFIYSPLIMLILGLVIGAYKDYFMTSKVITQDLRAHMQAFEAKEDKFKIALTVANFGNRPSTVTELLPTFPLAISWASDSRLYGPSTTKVQGIPAIVNPGNIQSIIIEGTLPITAMYEFGRLDGVTRISPITLHIRSLDFTGERYDLVWQVAELSIFPERVGGWGKLSYSVPLLDKRYSQGVRVSTPLRYDLAHQSP